MTQTQTQGDIEQELELKLRKNDLSLRNRNLRRVLLDRQVRYFAVVGYEDEALFFFKKKFPDRYLEADRDRDREVGYGMTLWIYGFMAYPGARSAGKGRCVEEEAEGGDEGALVVCEELDACRPIVKDHVRCRQNV